MALEMSKNSPSTVCLYSLTWVDYLLVGFWCRLSIWSWVDVNLTYSLRSEGPFAPESSRLPSLTVAQCWPACPQNIVEAANMSVTTNHNLRCVSHHGSWVKWFGPSHSNHIQMRHVTNEWMSYAKLRMELNSQASNDPSAAFFISIRPLSQK